MKEKYIEVEVNTAPLITPSGKEHPALQAELAAINGKTSIFEDGINHQTIGDVSNSTVLGCNISGSNNTIIACPQEIIDFIKIMMAKMYPTSVLDEVFSQSLIAKP